MNGTRLRKAKLNNSKSRNVNKNFNGKKNNKKSHNKLECIKIFDDANIKTDKTKIAAEAKNKENLSCIRTKSGCNIPSNVDQTKEKKHNLSKDICNEDFWDYEPIKYTAVKKVYSKKSSPLTIKPGTKTCNAHSGAHNEAEKNTDVKAYDIQTTCTGADKKIKNNSQFLFYDISDKEKELNIIVKVEELDEKDLCKYDLLNTNVIDAENKNYQTRKFIDAQNIETDIDVEIKVEKLGEKEFFEDDVHLNSIIRDNACCRQTSDFNCSSENITCSSDNTSKVKKINDQDLRASKVVDSIVIENESIKTINNFNGTAKAIHFNDTHSLECEPGINLEVKVGEINDKDNCEVEQSHPIVNKNVSSFEKDRTNIDNSMCTNSNTNYYKNVETNSNIRENIEICEIQNNKAIYNKNTYSIENNTNDIAISSETGGNNNVCTLDESEIEDFNDKVLCETIQHKKSNNVNPEVLETITRNTTNCIKISANNSNNITLEPKLSLEKITKKDICEDGNINISRSTESENNNNNNMNNNVDETELNIEIKVEDISDYVVCQNNHNQTSTDNNSKIFENATHTMVNSIKTDINNANSIVRGTELDVGQICEKNNCAFNGNNNHKGNISDEFSTTDIYINKIDIIDTSVNNFNFTTSSEYVTELNVEVKVEDVTENLNMCLTNNTNNPEIIEMETDVTDNSVRVQTKLNKVLTVVKNTNNVNKPVCNKINAINCNNAKSIIHETNVSVKKISEPDKHKVNKNLRNENDGIGVNKIDETYGNNVDINIGELNVEVKIEDVSDRDFCENKQLQTNSNDDPKILEMETCNNSQLMRAATNHFNSIMHETQINIEEIGKEYNHEVENLRTIVISSASRSENDVIEVNKIGGTDRNNVDINIVDLNVEVKIEDVSDRDFSENKQLQTNSNDNPKILEIETCNNSDLMRAATNHSNSIMQETQLNIEEKGKECNHEVENLRTKVNSNVHNLQDNVNDINTLTKTVTYNTNSIIDDTDLNIQVKIEEVSHKESCDNIVPSTIIDNNEIDTSITDNAVNVQTGRKIANIIQFLECKNKEINKTQLCENNIPEGVVDLEVILETYVVNNAHSNNIRNLIVTQDTDINKDVMNNQVKSNVTSNACCYEKNGNVTQTNDSLSDSEKCLESHHVFNDRSAVLSLKQLDIKLNAISNIYQCDTCKMAFLCKQKLQNHIKRHLLELKKTRKCRICDNDYKSHYLAKHVREVHGNNIHKCEQCNKSFKCKAYFNRHIAKKHKNELLYLKNHPLQYPPIFDNRPSYTHHINTVHTYKEECLICHEIVENLNIHLQRVHLTNEPESNKIVTNLSNKSNGLLEHQCHTCSQSFNERLPLLQHNLKHLVVKISALPNIFQCDYCKLAFICKRKLQNHIKIHSLEKRKCRICGNVYKYHYLAKHMREVHSSNNYKCEHCGKLFKCKRYLKKHLVKRHSIGTPTFNVQPKLPKTNLKCPHCPLVFGGRSSYTHHIYYVHREKEECPKCHVFVKELKVHLRRVNCSQSNKKDFQCSECKKFFKSFDYLKVHMRNAHKDFNCSICKKDFSSAYFFKTHKCT